MNRRTWIGSTLLILVIVGSGFALNFWKKSAQQAHASGQHYEPMESITTATATQQEYRRTTTSIGTVMALRSITLRNELPGTVRESKLISGQIVEEGALLIALDVAVEQAELKALEAQARLAENLLKRTEQASQTRAMSEVELDKARAERDIALAQIAKTKAIIDRKTIRAPFRARVGMADVHEGQFLNEGTLLTTLQGINEAVHIDFAVSQKVAAGLQNGDTVELVSGRDNLTAPAKIVAIDSRVDPATRNAMVRARFEGPPPLPAPGSSVRVRVPAGPAQPAVAIPVSALRKGPNGDHVFVIATAQDGKPRAQLRAVQSGMLMGDVVLVQAGLSAGEQVAALGSFKLREGVAVNVSQP